ncbi:hypothetical protein J0910_07905 [Nocardiopsis sp. CNT-189]|uniref:hypothetical protein n=1 Tax=Nocardiopsis oceanisediminis TaxID=2816862 RepID=UPI003B2BEF2F
MNPTILFLIAVAAAAVLCGVAYAVMGKGGRLARFEADRPPLDLPEGRGLTSADIGRLTLPLALWGYHVRGVDEVLRRASAALNERDEHIAELERRLAEVPASTGPRVLYPRTPPGGQPLGTGRNGSGEEADRGPGAAG